MITEKACRVCGGDLESILNLGDLHLSSFLAADEPLPPTAPLDLCACLECHLVQLRHTVEADKLFRRYWYRSGINESMREELADIVEKAINKAWLSGGDLVVDIGANDGTLLAAYPSNMLRVAFEPALNLNDQLHAQADIVIADYFPRGLREFLPPVKARIITSIACFYDVDDPEAFVRAIRRLLHREGVWVVQFQDWDQMQRATAFDNLVHEHLIYYSLASFQRLLAPFDLQVTDCEIRAINGGSYRLYIQHAGKPVSRSVEALLHQEEGCERWETLEKFAWRAQEVRRQLQNLLHDLQTRGRVIDLYGASTKFSTLAQWCAIDGSLLRQAWERTPEKVGLRTLTGIPIVSEVSGRLDPPDGLLVGIWQYRDQILRREATYLEQGGQLIFPLPRVEIVSR